MLWYAKAFSKLLPIGPAAFVVGSGVERRRDRIHPDHSLRFAALWSRGNGHGTASNPFPETKIWTRISDNDAVTSWPERCHRLGGRCGKLCSTSGTISCSNAQRARVRVLNYSVRYARTSGRFEVGLRDGTVIEGSFTAKERQQFGPLAPVMCG